MLFGLSPVILSHVILLHLLQQFHVLSFGDLFIANAHVRVEGSNPSHGDVGDIGEVYGIFIDFKLIFLEKIKIKKFSLFLVVNGLNIRVLIIFCKLHLAIVFDGKVHDISGRTADFSEIVQLDVVVSDGD